MRFMRLIEIVGFAAFWAAAVYGALGVQHWIGSGKHSICGPWGCGPPTGSLVSLHLGWLAAIGPPLIYLPLRLKLSRRWAGRIALSSIVLGAVGLLSIVSWQWFVWLPQASQWSREYIWQRCGFVVATTVDFPLVQLLVAGLLLWILVALRSRSSESPQMTGCSTALD
jgi:hypothetical protein